MQDTNYLTIKLKYLRALNLEIPTYYTLPKKSTAIDIPNKSKSQEIKPTIIIGTYNKIKLKNNI